MEHQFPTLFGLATNGKHKEWSISLKELEDKTILTTVLNGYIDGKKAKSERITKKGKNIGKKNETTPYQQAFQEAERKWIDKKEKEGYSETLDEVQIPVYPMLAHKYEIGKKKKKDIVFPCLVQPKLDGYRCMSFKTSKINLMSRVGKMFKDLPHLMSELERFISEVKKQGFNDIYLDGELYSDVVPFEEIAGIIRTEKKSQPEKEVLIKYHIYDIYLKNDMNFENRNKVLEKAFKKKYNFLKPVELLECPSINQIKEFHGNFVERGFEGLMLRNKNGVYLCKNRSHDLQKYKEFQDEEYKIVGFKEASGEDKGTIIWICEYQNNEGKTDTFAVRPKGSREFRKQFFDECSSDFSQYQGKWLKVKFQELSETLCPRFPVGLEVRFDI